MTTAYSYDIRNRMTKIEYKDGEAVLDGFTYTLSAGSNIVTTAHADGAEWTYEYDGRHRLTKAERDNDGDTITATYEYTYDDGDSLITKVEPFSDDFNDTNYTGWTVGAGTWSASSGAMRNTVTSESWSYFSRSQSDADHDLQFTYVCNDDSDSGYTLRVEARFTGWSDDRLCLYVEPDMMILKEMVNGGSWTWLSTNTSADTDEGTEYNVRMECDDDDITVWRGEVGGGMSQVLSTSSATVTSTNSIYFDVSPDADYSIDNIRLIADDLTTTTTFAYDDANELTSMTNNGTVNFAYDDWGRVISKWQGDFDATYAYRYGDKLYSITSDFNGEGTVTYQYGADEKRRQRTADSVTTKYRWDAGWNMINEDNVLDVLTMTYIARGGGVLAELTGTVPSSGTARYYCHDHLRSTRRLRASDKSSSGQYEFTPCGSPYSESGISLAALGGAFVGKAWDGAAHAYYFPYRYYSPTQARWLTRDPLGMVDGPNVYQYARANSIGNADPLGLKIWVCTRQANKWIKGLRHTYLWDDRGDKGHEAFSTTDSCGRGDPDLDANSDDPVSLDNDDNRGPDDDLCVPIEGSEGHEEDIFECCRPRLNSGLFCPLLNDCRGRAKRCIKKAGFKWPRGSGGRFGFETGPTPGFE